MPLPILIPESRYPPAVEELCRVYRGATLLARKLDADGWEDALIALFEHKGGLFACWRSLATQQLFSAALHAAWHATGEYASIVHWIDGEEIPGDAWNCIGAELRNLIAAAEHEHALVV